MSKSILIIGAGIAGLSAGCYARMNGYSATILEMGKMPGGLCMAWKRKGYTFEGCIHWLAGSGAGTSLHRIWQELGAVQGIRFVNHEALIQLELSGQTFLFDTDIDRLEAHLMTIGPQDEEVIHEIAEAVREFARLDLPVEKPAELMTAEDEARLQPLRQFFLKWNSITTGEIAARFQHPFLHAIFSMLWGGPMPALLIIMQLAYTYKKSAGYPIGGSLAFARAIEKRFLDLGGDILYDARVSKILVEKDCAVGVRLADGREIRAENAGEMDILSAADGHTTIFDLLDGRYLDDTIRMWYDHIPLIPAVLQVSLGVNMPMADIPSTVSGVLFYSPQPVMVGEQSVEWLGTRVFNFDPMMAPAGKTALTVSLPGDFTYWKKLENNPTRYQTEKDEIARQVIAALDVRFPGLAAQVEVVDVATPLTFESYTGNWQGSSQGWIVTPDILNTWLPSAQPNQWRWKKTLPGLDHFYMAGQWVEPGGGIPPAAYSARNVVQLICARDQKPFTTSLPLR